MSRWLLGSSRSRTSGAASSSLASISRLCWPPLKGHAGPGVQSALAVVGPVEPGEQAQQGGLAHAVGPDQADALAGVELEADVLKQRPFVKPAGQAGTAQQDHGRFRTETADEG